MTSAGPLALAAALIAAAPAAADKGTASYRGATPRPRWSRARTSCCEPLPPPGSTIRPGSYVRQGVDVGWLDDDAVVGVVIDFSVVYAHGAGAAAMNVACLYSVEDRRIVGARVATGYRTFRVP